MAGTEDSSRGGLMTGVRGAVAALTAALLILAPGLANADTRTHADAAGDVQYLVNTDPENIPPPVAVPARTVGDITVVRLVHGTTTVRVVARYRSLPRAGQFHGHVFRFVTGRLVRKAQIAAGPEAPRGWTGLAEMFTAAGNPVACRMNHLLDYPNRRLVLNVPRTCLRNPVSVRVGVGTVVLAGDRTYFDDGYRTGGTMGMAELRPTLGPFVRR